LVHNALKYGRNDQGIARIELRVEQQSQQVHVTVRDQGPGVTASAQAQLFQPFFTTSDNGTGLGLYIAQELARASGAKLAYTPHDAQDSNEGDQARGACFVISLPTPGTGMTQ
jgi:two-component system sensor histidine kinase PilS (NtrC family)